MMQCIAIDDEPLALELLENFCARVPFLKLQKTFTRTSEASRHLKKTPVDLLFLDIQMPDMLGTDFYKSVTQSTMVIFTTAFSQYAVEGFSVSAIDYLMKPIDFNRFLQACERANGYLDYLKQSKLGEEQYLYVRAEYSLMKISFADILYIETLDDYIKIHLSGKKPVLTIMTMKKIMEKLPADFIRVHRSYIVSFKRIHSVRDKIIFLDTFQIPIGRNYEEYFFRKYNL